MRDLLVQVWNHEDGLVGADSARLIVARQELDLVLARQKREAGVVLDGPLGQIGGSCVRELDVDVVANIGDGGAADQVLDLADKVDEGVLGAAALGER